MEFGTSTTSFLNDYHLFTTGTAMLLVQHPGGPITVITLVTLLSIAAARASAQWQRLDRPRGRTQRRP